MQINIIKGHTRLAIHVHRDHPAAVYLRSMSSKVLTDHEFNPRIKRMVPTKRYVKYEHNTLYLPITLFDEVTALLTEMGFEYTISEEPLYTTRKLTIEMLDTFEPRPHQIEVIDYVHKLQPARKGVAVQTGGGKTVSSIAGSIKYGRAFIIVVSRLHHQWKESLQQFTNIREDQVCIIQGFKSLIDAMEAENKPEVFIFSLETLRAYCQHEGNYAELPKFEQFVNYFGIGTKIMDEVHLNFHACTLIDLSCNIPNNIYLTATFTSGNPGTRKIFNLIYPPSMRVGEQIVKRYSDGYCYGYRGSVPDRVVITQRGYFHIKYEKYLLKRPMLLKEYFDRVIMPTIQIHYLNKHNPGERMTIFFSMLEMIDYAYNYFKEHMDKKYKIAKYISGVSDDVLKEYDVIITTAKSCGAGTDIKQLRTCINTVSTKSPTAVLQIAGRLRELPGITTEYVEFCDLNIAAQVRHQREREYILKPVLKEYHKYKLA